MVSESIVIVTVIIMVAIMAVILVYAARYKKVPPDKAMVVYGRKMQPGVKIGYQVISGGGKFILPVIEAYEFLLLDVRTLDVNVSDIVTDVAKSAMLAFSGSGNT